MSEQKESDSEALSQFDRAVHLVPHILTLVLWLMCLFVACITFCVNSTNIVLWLLGVEPSIEFIAFPTALFSLLMGVLSDRMLRKHTRRVFDNVDQP